MPAPFPPSVAALALCWAPPTRRERSRSVKSAATKAQPAFLSPTEGLELAVGQVNAAGGVLERRCSWSRATITPARRRRARRRELFHAREGASCSWHLPLARWPGADRLLRKQRKRFFSPPSRSPTRSSGSRANRYTFRLRRLHLHAGGDARARRREAAEKALGHRLSQLRIRPVGWWPPSSCCSRPSPAWSS